MTPLPTRRTMTRDMASRLTFGMTSVFGDSKSTPYVTSGQSSRNRCHMGKQLSFDFPIPEGMKVIFRPYITLKNGQRLWAKQCGKRAFPLIVPA